jgi:hypothetical protein
MDLDITMIFLAGSTFIFGSWIYTADDSNKLQGCLVEILADQEAPANHQDVLEDLVNSESVTSTKKIFTQVLSDLQRRF